MSAPVHASPAPAAPQPSAMPPAAASAPSALPGASAAAAVAGQQNILFPSPALNLYQLTHRDFLYFSKQKKVKVLLNLCPGLVSQFSTILKTDRRIRLVYRRNMGNGTSTAALKVLNEIEGLQMKPILEQMTSAQKRCLLKNLYMIRPSMNGEILSLEEISDRLNQREDAALNSIFEALTYSLPEIDNYSKLQARIIQKLADADLIKLPPSGGEASANAAAAAAAAAPPASAPSRSAEGKRDPEDRTKQLSEGAVKSLGLRTMARKFAIRHTAEAAAASSAPPHPKAKRKPDRQ